MTSASTADLFKTTASVDEANETTSAKFMKMTQVFLEIIANKENEINELKTEADEEIRRLELEGVQRDSRTEELEMEVRQLRVDVEAYKELVLPPRDLVE